MKMQIGFAALLLFSCIVCSAASIAYRDQNSILYVVPDESTPEKVFKIGRVTGSYEVGNEIIAFRDGSELYIASTQSDWKPISVSSNVTSFEVQWSTVIFRKNASLYIVKHPDPKHAFGELVSKGIRDYSLFSADRGSRQVYTFSQYALPD
ncbi:MAG: hypothetical protein HY559_00455 [Gammaproteobacteria bacterium]|nr:hypothetical protein [Gammaproteobacteria bacterium]